MIRLRSPVRNAQKAFTASWWACKPRASHPSPTVTTLSKPAWSLTTRTLLSPKVCRARPETASRRLRIDLQCQQPSGIQVLPRSDYQPAQHVQPLNSRRQGQASARAERPAEARRPRRRSNRADSTPPRPPGPASASNRSPCCRRTRPSSPCLLNVLVRDAQCPSAHVRRTHRPRSEDDIASATAIAPLPVPMSAIVRSLSRPRPRLRAYPNTASTRNSVSCRGTSTSGVTTKSSP